MEDKIDRFETLVSLVTELEEKGVEPVLVGGMALILLGSRRVTFDIDFVVSFQEELIQSIIDVFYKRNFELVSKLDKHGNVIRTIDNKNVAAIRLKLDRPETAFFFHSRLQLKIDFLFDFPFPAQEILTRAERIKVKSHSLHVACYDDLLRMKEMAYADRKKSTDAQDLEFLRELKRK